jgi:uncharacterized protein YdhG (YjbR/CyaY superfamily)
MAKTSHRSVDEYLSGFPDDVRAVLERVRGAIRRALPRATEVISYQIPAYRLPSGVVLYFAGWKRHFSLYPASPALAVTFREELASYEMSKGTIRFPLEGPVPVQLIGRIARFRARESAARAATRTRRTAGR